MVKSSDGALGSGKVRFVVNLDVRFATLPGN